MTPLSKVSAFTLVVGGLLLAVATPNTYAATARAGESTSVQPLACKPFHAHCSDASECCSKVCQPDYHSPWLCR